MRLSISFIKTVFFFLFLTLLDVHNTSSQNLIESVKAADKAFYLGEYIKAEIIYSKVLKQDPKNYHGLKSLAETKIKLDKLQEAEQLVDRILAMPVTTGRDILVFKNGENQSQEAELIDENVLAIDQSTKQDDLGTASKYVIQKDPDPLPHFRVYFKKTGKMKLLPHSQTRIQYTGIPEATRKLAKELKNRIRKIIISKEEVGKEEMIALKGGCFQMGSEKGDPDEQPVHPVCVRLFKLAKFEVTQKFFQSQMGFNPSQNTGADLPVDSVTWDDANDYCKKTGRRLPTEAEWEYATRAGTQTEYYWGNATLGSKANFCDKTCALNIRNPNQTDGFKHTAPVGSFPPNNFGLHDMAGNVGEWVADWMDESYYRISPKENPLGPNPDLEACGVGCAGSTSIDHKVWRGGAWNQRADELRSANRRDSRWQLRAEGIGFRCADNP